MQTSNSHDSGLKTTADKHESKGGVGGRDVWKPFGAAERQKRGKASLKEKADVRNPPIPLWAKAYPDNGKHVC